ncbi:hypothetical protein FRB90_006983, partial [Tulasnella sp. 427]
MASLLRAPTAQASQALRHRLASTPSVLLVSQQRWASSTGTSPDIKQPPEAGAQGPAKLPWPQYFKIRKNKRNWEV